jgi:hypothetical protein
VVVFMGASFNIAVDGFGNCTWRNFQFFKCSGLTDHVLNDGLLFLFVAYLSCSCHNMDLVFYQTGLPSVYHLWK